MCRLDTVRRYSDIHAACQDRDCSATTIRQIVSNLGVEILEKQDVYGRVPLFYALRKRCSLSVFETLFDNCPSAILQADFCGELPLYMIFHPKTDCRILEYVLNKNPSLALYQEKRFSGTQSLLQRLCIQWAYTINAKSPLLSSSLPHASSVLSRKQIYSDSVLYNQWAKLVLTVCAVHHATHDKTVAPQMETNTTRMDVVMETKKVQLPSKLIPYEIPELHAAMQLACLPPGMICQFVEMYSEQVALPILNISVGKTNSNAMRGSEMAYGMGVDECHKRTTGRYSDPVRSMLPLHFFLSGYSKLNIQAKPSTAIGSLAHCRARAKALRSFIHAYPLAAARLHPSSSNRLPIHVAIEAGIFWEDGLRELVYANPLALAGQGKQNSRLFPFLYQAMAPRRGRHEIVYDLYDDKENLRLDATYRLLREDPSVISRLLPLSPM